MVNDDSKYSILVLGSTGRVGRLLLPYWSSQNFANLEITYQHRSKRRPDGLYWDILKDGPKPLLGHIEKCGQVKAMIVLLGAVPGGKSELSYNKLLAEICLQSAHSAGIERVLIASSSAIYGGGTGSPFSENDTPKPNNSYGAAKLEMEEACKKWLDTELNLTCLRIGNVAGADALLSSIIDKYYTRKLEIDRFPDGHGPFRSYIGPGTLARVLITLATFKSKLPFLLNIATPEPIAMETLVDACNYPYQWKTAPKNSTQRIVLDCTLLRKFFRFSNQDCEPLTMVNQIGALAGKLELL